MPAEREVLAALRRYYAPKQGRQRYVLGEHVRDAAGYSALRTADLVAQDTWPSTGLEIIGHEVKVSRSDWLAELKTPGKAEAVRRLCHRWYLVVSDPKIVKDDLPAGWGLMTLRGDKVRMTRKSVLGDPSSEPAADRASFAASFARAVARTSFEYGRESVGEGRTTRARQASSDLSYVRYLVSSLTSGYSRGSVPAKTIYQYTKSRSNMTQERARAALATMWAAGEIDLVGDEVVITGHTRRA